MFKKDKSKDNKEKSLNENPFIEDTNQEPEENAESKTGDKLEDDSKTVNYEEFSDLKNKYEKLDEDKKTIDAHYLRLAADFDNFRKRQEQERESLLKYGAEDTLKKLLPVIDTFERAQKSFKDLDDPEKIKESIDAIKRQFMDALEKLGVEKIETVGKEFDPNFHEAVMQTPTQEQPDHTVIAELQSGYKLNDKILRPALVNVAVNE